MIYTPIVKKAAEIALQAHQGQLDKGGYPYIFHPIHLAEQMDDEDSCVVALLHDTIEDSSVTLLQLKSYGFSQRQINAIDALTHRPGIDYLEYIVKQVCPNPLASKIKLKDLQHNLEMNRLTGSTYHLDEAHLNRYRQAITILGNSLCCRKESLLENS